MKRKKVSSSPSSRRFPFSLNLGGTDFVLLVTGAVVVIMGVVLLSSTQFKSIYSGSTQSVVHADTSLPAQSAVKLNIQNFMFDQKTVVVKLGGSVTWVNRDTTMHTVMADNGSFTTKPILSGESAMVTFSKAGTYTYHCANHPAMTATVIVQ